jgi:hypothetical protein
MMHRIVKFFDKLEDKVRGALSHFPILYAFVGGVGVVLFWKGVWETAEIFPSLYGLGSVAVSVIILLVTGLFVFYFIGDNIIITGLRSQKKIVDKTEKEIHAEENEVVKTRIKIAKIERDMEEIKELLKHIQK